MTAAERIGDFIFRDVRAEDRDEVLAFTEHTFDFGDYIQYTFDPWLADPTGRFIAIEEVSSGKIAAIDKLSFLTPTEAWFEGLRVNPEYRGRGIATRAQRYMIEQARKLGARYVRLVTLAVNRPVHVMAYRDGFSLRAAMRFWKWTADQEPGLVDALNLRPANAGEAPALYEWWLRGSAYRTAGLLHRGWKYSSSSADEWVQSATKGMLFLQDGLNLAGASTPPPLVLVKREDYREDATWEVAAFAGPDESLPALFRALQDEARQAGATEISSLFPETVEVHHALELAGFTPDEQELPYLFELDITPDQSV